MPYLSADDLKDRIGEAYTADTFFDYNEEQRFETLLEQLESEAVGLLESRWGDEPFEFESDRVDELQATDDAAIALPYPVQDVSEVEVKTAYGNPWETLDADRYDHTEHRLVLQPAVRSASPYRSPRRTNPLLRNAGQQTWSDYWVKLRVTYDRGFQTLPGDVENIVADIVMNMLRKLRTEQNVAAMTPDEIEAFLASRAVLTDGIRDRIDTITKPSGATMSV